MSELGQPYPAMVGLPVERTEFLPIALTLEPPLSATRTVLST